MAVLEAVLISIGLGCLAVLLVIGAVALARDVARRRTSPRWTCRGVVNACSGIDKPVPGRQSRWIPAQSRPWSSASPPSDSRVLLAMANAAFAAGAPA